MPAQAAITFEEYLQHIPSPYVEYVNGQLKGRPAVPATHGVMQSALSGWFGQHRNAWKLLTGLGVRRR